jgi:LysM domain
MSNSDSSKSAVQRATRAADRRTRTTGSRKRVTRRERNVTRVLSAVIAIAIVVLLIRALRADQRDAHAIAERELRVNTLQPGEELHRSTAVFKRSFLSYFRATRGILALTDRRLVYLGVEPRDILAAPDLPPTFEQQEFPLDTSVHVSSGRAIYGLTKGIVITTPTERIRLAVPSASASAADLLIASVNAQRDRAVAEAAQRGADERRIEAARRAVEADRRKPKYYVVKRGDALGGIATMWNTTTDQLRDWNKVTGNRIRVGQSLLVRPGF